MMRNLETELRELIKKKKESSRRNLNISEDRSEAFVQSPKKSAKRLNKCESTDNFARFLSEDSSICELRTELSKKEQIIEQQKSTIIEQAKENAALRSELAKYKAIVEQQQDEEKKELNKKSSQKSPKGFPKAKELAIETPQDQINQEDIETTRNANSKKLNLRTYQAEAHSNSENQNFPPMSPKKQQAPLTPKKANITQTQSSEITLAKSPRRTVESILSKVKINIESLRFKPRFKE